MTTKRYRAATMREALEQVRQELGDNALVLDTKNVRAGGILGFGSREMVEVRVAAEHSGSERAANDRGISNQQSSASYQPNASGRSRLNITDDSPAAPSASDDSKGKNAVTSTSLAPRFAKFSAPQMQTMSDASTFNDDAASSRVELAETAPRVVHRPAALGIATTTSTITDATPAILTAAPDTAKHNLPSPDIDRLYAELREVKFTLGNLTARAAAHTVAPEAFASYLSLAATHNAAFERDADIYESPLYEAYMELTETGFAPEVARHIVRTAKDFDLDLTATEAPDAFTRRALIAWLESNVKFAADPFIAASDIDVIAAESQKADPHQTVVFIGPTGVGKTTTIAKLAAIVALRQRRRVELITLDTYRIAAVEQLKTYAEIIGAGFHVASSVLELDALARKFAGQATVLVDTTGRSPHDLADQIQLADYLRANDDFIKCLVLPATTHAADATLSARKFALHGVNRLAFTKLDETSRPGACAGVAAEANLPLLYLCAGQRVPEDLDHASVETLANRILRR